MIYSSEDTIAGISTALSESGIGIIRISGPDAIKAADLVFRPSKGSRKLADAPSHTIHYGFIIDDDGYAADEVLVSVMRAPRTYTAEDTIEINCHGGVYVITKVLGIVLNCARRAAASEELIHIRTAQPGEFTKRAYLNGRIDLSQAEAVMDLIESKNDFALRNSISQVRGSLYEKITSLRSSILYQTAHIEASLDDPENMDFAEYTDELRISLDSWMREIRQLSDTFDNGRMAAEGIRTVILGKPNAGKSSLLNLLVGEDRAIVTDIAGTTRDTLTETVRMNGFTLLLTDTAGIRDTSDVVEMIGVDRARNSAAGADLVLWVVDSSTMIDENDRSICSIISGKQAVILLNKSDLKTVTGISDVRSLLSDYNICLKNGKPVPVIPFCASDGEGLDHLISAVSEMFFSGSVSWNDEVVITNERQKRLLDMALESLSRVRESMDRGMSEDFFSIDLMGAYETLGEIIGQEIGDDLADEIFSRFCMGK